MDTTKLFNDMIALTKQQAEKTITTKPLNERVADFANAHPGKYETFFDAAIALMEAETVTALLEGESQ